MTRKSSILTIYHFGEYSAILEPLKNNINGARRFKAFVFKNNNSLLVFTYTFTSHYMAEEDEARFIVDYHLKHKGITLDDIEDLEEE